MQNFENISDHGTMLDYSDLDETTSITLFINTSSCRRHSGH